MATSGIKKRISGFFRALWSLVAPKTPRGKVRRATFFVAALLLVAATIVEPKYWNSAADAANAQLSKIPVPAGLRTLPRFPVIPFRLGLDLQGGSHLVYVADVKDIPESDQSDAMNGVRDVIERRVNAYGVSEPVIQTNKSGNVWRVIVDLAGVKDISQAISLIGGTPVLEFKEQSNEPPRPLTPEEKKDEKTYNDAAAKRAADVLAKALAPGADFAALAKQYSEDAATKDNGGDLGIVGQDNPLFPLTQIVNDLKPGEVFPHPANIPGGLHIVKLITKTQSGTEVRASHILICYKGADRCTKERTKDEAKALAEKLRAQATTANFADLAKANSDEPGADKSGGDLGFFTKDQLVKPFADVVFAMQKGTISGVVETQFGFHIIEKTDERPTYDYHLAHILVKLKQDTDYVPNEPWKNTQLSGKNLSRAVLQFDPQTNAPEVGITFNDEGKKLFGELTTRNVGKPIAIFLDGAPISTPNVNEPITGGSAVISGNFTVPEAKLLAQRLNAGALPVPITLESQQTVGASLGKDSIDSSLKAGLIGFLLVALFMLFYYRLPGLIAIIALSLYTVVNLALYKLIPVTLSLSGIAGLILSVGMAVDANVLIFERLKEEIFRGRPLSSAVDEGFKRAWTSIRDSNVTTLISCTILFYTSSSLIRGFALTLALGVLISMFSAITASRTLLRLVAAWKPFRDRIGLYLPAFARNPNPIRKDDDKAAGV